VGPGCDKLLPNCADDIPLGAFGGTCMELTFGGRPDKNISKLIN